MILTRVEYLLYRSDQWWLSHHCADALHSLDGEICLEDESGAQTYLSWSAEVARGTVAVSSSTELAGAGILREDQTRDALWSPLVGQEIEIVKSDKTGDLVKLTASAADLCLWCYAFSDANALDVLCVSSKKPASVHFPTT